MISVNKRIIFTLKNLNNDHHNTAGTNPAVFYAGGDRMMKKKPMEENENMQSNQSLQKDLERLKFEVGQEMGIKSQQKN